MFLRLTLYQNFNGTAVANDFQQMRWDDKLREDCRALVRLALAEDLNGRSDVTTAAVVPPEQTGAANVVVRQPGIVAGLPTMEIVVAEANARIEVTLLASDGEQVAAGSTLARLRGNAADLLTCERTMLNLLGRLMGIATLTNSYVAKTAGTQAKIYDTRKTTLGWRRLEKYAVLCGGGHNHRTGLFDAVLIKDNHLAQSSPSDCSPADAVRLARKYVGNSPGLAALDLPIEIEVDTLEQFSAVLPAEPDIVLLDNMSPEQLLRAVELRNDLAPDLVLEASGGVNLETLPEISATGVDRISVGGLTHSACSLDVGLDWQPS